MVEWSTGETVFFIEDLVPGIYTMTVTDANDCVTLDTVIVQGANCNLTIETSVTPASCPGIPDGLAIVLSVPGGAMPLDYIWSNGNMSPFASDLLPDDYTVTVTDANGCSIETSVTVTADDDEAPILALQDYSIELDENGLAILLPEDVDIGSSDNCSMVNLMLSQMEFDCDDVGDVAIEVTGVDSNGNSSMSTVTVTVLDLIEPTITCPDDFSVFSCDTVFYDLPIAEDNCNNVDLEILDGFESGEPFPAGETLITYRATDINDNSSECSFTITVEYDLATELEGTDPTCAGYNDGLIDLMILGGLSPYQAIWDHGGNTANLPAGEYVVTVTDQNGCTTSNSIELNDPPPFSADVLNVTPATNSSTPGNIELTISGGISPWTLTWYEDGMELPNFDPAFAPPGNYDVVIVDANGCTITLEDILVDNLNGTADREFDQQIDLFPNPASASFFVKMKMPNHDKVMVQLFDVTGKLHLTTSFDPIQNQAFPIEIADFSSGVYWVKIFTDKTMAWRKLVVY